MIENFIALRAGAKPAPQLIRIDTAAPDFNAAVCRVIRCDLYEVVRVQCGLLPPGVILLADESGLYKEPLRLNKFATVFYGEPIFGDVLLAAEGYRNGEPDIVGLDGYQLQWLRRAFCI